MAGIAYGMEDPTMVELQQDAVAEELAARRLASGPVLVGGAAGAELTRVGSGSTIIKSILDEYQQLRDDVDNRDRQRAELVNTYQNYLSKTGNPVELFVHQPNYYAAMTTPQGDDVVWLDKDAPQNSHFAHELGHIAMNHSTDPISFLQTSGIGKTMQSLAPITGAASTALGYDIGRRSGNRLAGALIGGGAGLLASTPNTIYELEASRRGLGYINPEDTSTAEYLGDVVPAGLTYALGGPALAGVTGLTALGVKRWIDGDEPIRRRGK